MISGRPRHASQNVTPRAARRASGRAARPGPIGGREVVAARELQVPRDLGARSRRGARQPLDGQRDSQMGALRVAQVRPGGLGEQRVPVRDAAAHAPGHPRVEKAAFGVSVGGPQRCELRHRERPSHGRHRLGQLPRGVREPPERRADHCPEVRWRRDAARRQRPGALDCEQRISLSRCDHLRERAVGQCRDAARDLRHLRGGQRAELDLGDVEPAAGEVGQQRVGVGAVRSIPAG